MPAAWIKKLAERVVRSQRGAGFERRCELSVVITGDAWMKRLNRKFRGKDRTTDVLSFPQWNGKGPFPDALGDVLVSLPQARRQAREQGKSLEAELALLLAHGILHLLGHDHATQAQEKRMFALQEKFVRSHLRRKARKPGR